MDVVNIEIQHYFSFIRDILFLFISQIMEKTDKRTQNHVTGEKRENKVFSLLKAFHDSGLIVEEPIRAGGRINNFDMLLNNKKVEVKDNAMKIDDLLSLEESINNQPLEEHTVIDGGMNEVLVDS